MAITSSKPVPDLPHFDRWALRLLGADETPRQCAAHAWLVIHFDLLAYPNGKNTILDYLRVKKSGTFISTRICTYSLDYHCVSTSPARNWAQSRALAWQRGIHVFRSNVAHTLTNNMVHRTNMAYSAPVLTSSMWHQRAYGSTKYRASYFCTLMALTSAQKSSFYSA